MVWSERNGAFADIYAAGNAAKLAEMWEVLRPKMTNVYERLPDYRDPDKMVPYSITTHNVTFDLAQKMFRIAVQEDYANTFDFYLVESVPVVPGEPIGPFDTPTSVTAKDCGVPGFYYSFYSGGAVTNLRALANETGRNVLCGTGRDVNFGVEKPSAAAGFFSIDVRETSGVQPSDRAVPAGAPIITPAFVEE